MMTVRMTCSSTIFTLTNGLFFPTRVKYLYLVLVQKELAMTINSISLVDIRKRAETFTKICFITI